MVLGFLLGELEEEVDEAALGDILIQVPEKKMLQNNKLFLIKIIFFVYFY